MKLIWFKIKYDERIINWEFRLSRYIAKQIYQNFPKIHRHKSSDLYWTTITDANVSLEKKSQTATAVRTNNGTYFEQQLYLKTWEQSYKQNESSTKHFHANVNKIAVNRFSLLWNIQ